ncbi:MAG: hypothetical protein RL169_335 [Armatimonadota bacterium]
MAGKRIVAHPHHCHQPEIISYATSAIPSPKSNKGRLAPHVFNHRIILFRMKLRIHKVINRSPCSESHDQDSNPDQTAEARLIWIQPG